MYNILTINDISSKGIDKFEPENFLVDDCLKEADGILVRSADLHNYDMPQGVLAIARAGAGTNNIPVDKCTSEGIVVFNTPGANANAVKELVLTGMLLSSRKIFKGIEWSKTLKGQEGIEAKVEKGKKAFVGPELHGKTLGVVGLGAIGVLVANMATALGMEVVGYDPYLSVHSALKLEKGIILADTIDGVLANADYITLHLPYNKNTNQLINSEMFAKMKEGVRLLNFARGELVDNHALKTALEDGVVYRYVTDFPCEEVLNMKNVIAMPHLGGSTPESEENCAVMAALEIKDFLQYGIIKNSINLPDCDLAFTGKPRLTLVHRNIPKMVGGVTAIIADENLNIDNMVNKSKGDVAYTVVDLDGLSDKEDELLELLRAIPGMIKVRLIK
ncbi:MAG: 3-phosphoglycerate dehydrogenase [Epulopiscium sp. Nele67-Bin004]|nr:MAG: 3-phosphoglycerate dehydrogenase [Epulopiscium sp. Nele67-Bin004]